MHISTRLSLLAALPLTMAIFGTGAHAEPIEGPLGGKTPRVIQQLEAWLDELPDGFPCRGRYYDARHELPEKLAALRRDLFSLKIDLPMTIFWLEGAAEDKEAVAIAYESTDHHLANVHASLTDLVDLIGRTPCSAPSAATATLGEVLEAQNQAKAQRASATLADAQAGIRQVKQLEALLIRLEEQLTQVTDSAYQISMQAYQDTEIKEPVPPTTFDRLGPYWAARRAVRVASAASKAWLVQNAATPVTAN